MRALFVEPSAAFQNIISLLMKEIGVEFRGMNKRVDAERFLEGEVVDLVLVTHYLAEGHAFDFIQKAGGKGGRYVLLTSDDDEEIFDQAKACGYEDVFLKSDLAGLIQFLHGCAESFQEKCEVEGRVLYLEDSKAMTRLMTRVFGVMKLDYDHFETVEEGAEAFSKGRKDYDLVISDFHLRGELTGMDMVKVVRKVEKKDECIPILVISSSSDFERRVKVLEGGADDYILKPFAEKEVMAKIGNALSRKKLLDQVKGQKERIEEMSVTDTLTKLHHRQFLMATAPKLISAAKRHQFPASVLLIDLDKFGQLNGTRGPILGDMVLIEVAQAIKDHAREEDLVAHYSGDQFVVLMTNCDLASAERKGSFFSQKIRDLQPAGVSVTASVGATGVGKGTYRRFSDMLVGVEMALKLAKEAGGDQCIGVLK